MSLNKQIQQILQKESIKFTTKQQQNNFILKKLNISFLYYLLSECKGYSFEFEINNNFIFINKIIKENHIIWSVTNFTSSENIRKTIQLEKLAELIENESELKFEFTDSMLFFELIKCVDKYKREIDLIQFFKKYEKENDLCYLLQNQNYNGNESYLNNKMIEDNYNFNESYSETIEDNVLNNQFKRDFNTALIYYLLTECKGYEIFSDCSNENNFIYIQTITKDDKIIYDIKSLDDIDLAQKEKLQFNKLTELLKK